MLKHISYSLYPKIRAKYIENETFIIDSIYFKQRFILDSIAKAAWYSFYKEELKKDTFNIIENMAKEHPIQSEAFRYARLPYEEKKYEKELINIRERVKKGPKKGIKNAYINTIYKEALKEDNIFETYFLYDITKDGKPELFILTGSCDADSELLIYTYKNRNIKLIHKISGGAFYSYYKRKNYLLMAYQRQGEAYCYKLNYNNRRIKKKKIFEENAFVTDANGDYLYDRDYTQPPGVRIETFSCMDTIPIYDELK